MVLFHVLVSDPLVDVDPGDVRRNDNGEERWIISEARRLRQNRKEKEKM